MGLNKTTTLAYSLLFISLFCTGMLHAQVADLELKIEIENIENGVEFVQIGLLAVTITNFGPDDAGITSSSPLPVAATSGIIEYTDDGFVDVAFIQDFSFNEDCFFIRIEGSPIPGGRPHAAFHVNFPVIPVGTSMTCHGKYLVGFREGSRTITWRAVSGFNQSETDPNPSNNEVSLVFSIKPQVIPATGIFSLLIGFIFILLIGFWHKRKEHLPLHNNFLTKKQSYKDLKKISLGS